MLVYKITNLLNGKIYIGKTIQSVERRFKQHFSKARQTKENNRTHFQNSLNLYGILFFDYQVICFAHSIQELNILETYWINFFNSRNFDNGYNIAEGGDNSKHSFETKNKISEKKKGRKWSALQKEIRSDSMKGEKNHFYGKNHTNEAKEKIKLRNIGKTYTELEKKNFSDKNKGKKRTLKQKQNYINAQRNKLPKNKLNFKGVREFIKKDGNKSYNARISLFSGVICLGTFSSSEAAAIAYNEACDKYWGIGVGYRNII